MEGRAAAALFFVSFMAFSYLVTKRLSSLFFAGERGRNRTRDHNFGYPPRYFSDKARIAALHRRRPTGSHTRTFSFGAIWRVRQAVADGRFLRIPAVHYSSGVESGTGCNCPPWSKRKHWFLIMVRSGVLARAILLLAAGDDLQRIVG